MLDELFILTKTNIYFIIIIATLLIVGGIIMARWLWGKSKDLSLAYVALVMGAVLNTFVKVANGGKFPVNGYTMLEIQEKSYRVWNYIPGEGAKLNILGDHPELGGASVGDLFLFIGAGLIVGYYLCNIVRIIQQRIVKQTSRK